MESAAFGSVSGRLERLSTHGRTTFTLWPPMSGEQVECRFLEERLPEVVAAINKHVTVLGLLHYATNKSFPVRVDVDEFEIHPDNNELASLLPCSPPLIYSFFLKGRTMIIRIDNASGHKVPVDPKRAKRIIGDHYDDAEHIWQELLSGSPVRTTFATFQAISDAVRTDSIKTPIGVIAIGDKVKAEWGGKARSGTQRCTTGTVIDIVSDTITLDRTPRQKAHVLSNAIVEKLK